MQLTKPRILYAEDHQDTREFVSVLLGCSNYEVIAIEEGYVALNRARQEQFDLYLLDTRLPDVSGLEICQRIREFDSATPILFFSGAAYEADKKRALSCGAQAYLTKPDDLDALPETISRLIEDSKSASLMEVAT